VFGHEKEKYNASGMIRITILPVTGKSHTCYDNGAWKRKGIV
jgi:hypothetical protein